MRTTVKIPPPTHWLKLEEAKRLDLCRICRRHAQGHGIDNPLILNWGNEFAHARCLQAARESFK